jgi:hypothetical protein
MQETRVLLLLLLLLLPLEMWSVVHCDASIQMHLANGQSAVPWQLPGSDFFLNLGSLHA